MKLLHAMTFPLFAALGACHPAYAVYVANDGYVHHDIDVDEAVRLSAQHDLQCEAGDVKIRRLVSGFRRGPVDEVAEGCGHRVVLREECGPQREILSPASPENERESASEEDEERPYACRHVLLSRVETEPRRTNGVRP